MNGKLLAIVRREYLERVRSKSFVVATILGPVLMAALMVVPAIMATRRMPAVPLKLKKYPAQERAPCSRMKWPSSSMPSTSVRKL